MRNSSPFKIYIIGFVQGFSDVFEKIVCIIFSTNITKVLYTKNNWDMVIFIDVNKLYVFKSPRFQKKKNNLQLLLTPVHRFPYKGCVLMIL